MYPSTEQTASGVYSLVTYGHVSASHVEHPDAFITELLRQEQSGDYGILSLEERIRLMNRQVVPPPHRLTGAWNSGFGSTLEDVYHNRGVFAPRFTTKTRYVGIYCTNYCLMFEGIGVIVDPSFEARERIFTMFQVKCGMSVIRLRYATVLFSRCSCLGDEPPSYPYDY